MQSKLLVSTIAILLNASANYGQITALGEVPGPSPNNTNEVSVSEDPAVTFDKRDPQDLTPRDQPGEGNDNINININDHDGDPDEANPEDDSDDEPLALLEKRESKEKPKQCARVTEYCHKQTGKWKCYPERLENMNCPKKPVRRGRLTQYLCKLKELTKYCPPNTKKCSSEKPKVCHEPKCSRNANTLITTCKCQYKDMYCYDAGKSTKCDESRPKNMHCSRKPKIEGHVKRYRCRPRKIVQYIDVGESKPTKTKPKPCYRPRCSRREHVTTCRCQYKVEYCYRKNKARKCQGRRPRNMHCTRKPRIKGHIKRFNCRPRKVVKYIPAGQTEASTIKPNPCYKPRCTRRGHVTTCRCQYKVEYCYRKNKLPKCQGRRPSNMHCTRKPKIHGHIKRYQCRPRKVVQYIPLGENKPTEKKPKPCYRPKCHRRGHVTTCRCRYRIRYCYRKKGVMKCQAGRPRNMHCRRKPHIQQQVKKFHCRPRKIVQYIAAGETKPTKSKPKPCYRPQCTRRGHVTTCRCQYQVQYCYRKNKANKCQTKRPRNMHCTRKPKVVNHFKRYQCRPRKVVQYVAYGETKPTKTKPKYCYKPQCTRKAHVTTCKCQREEKYCVRKEGKWECRKKLPKCPRANK